MTLTTISRLLCISALCFLWVTLVAASKTPLVSEAAERTKLIETLKVRFQRTENWRRGAASAGGTDLLSKGNVVPSSDTKLESENWLFLDGKQLRYENCHPMFQFPEGVVFHHRLISTTNTKIAASLLIPDEKSSKVNVGAIYGTPESFVIQVNELQPLLLFCRGNDPSLCAFPLDRFKATGRTLAIQGRMCEEFVLQVGTSIHYWADPSRGYAIVRMQSRNKGHIRHQTDIEYGPNAVTTHFPVQWVQTQYNDKGQVRFSNKISVLNTEIGKDIEPASFELTFPPNTYYADRRTGKEYKVDESGVSREHDFSGAPGSPPGGSAVSWLPENWWVWLILGVVAIMLVVFVVIRWTRRTPGIES